MSQFVDQAEIEVKAGRGGDGASHFLREKYMPRGGPDGGDGGHGGNVIIAVDEGLRTLVDFRFQRTFEAESGHPGEGKQRTGASGADAVVPVPPGTLVYDADSGQLLADLEEPGQRFTICHGGRGGRGNANFATAVKQAPIYRELGEPPEERRLRLELKLLADAALVGFPNAGKSTLISRLSAARPKIANYPFTTLTPNLGVVRLDSGASFVLADLPGLIEGAAEGKGLGHEFLRHLERARVIVHVLDVSGIDRLDPVADYDAIRSELRKYDPHLASLPEIVVANKVDLPDAETMIELIEQALRERGVNRLHHVSAVSGTGVPALLQELSRLVFSTSAQSAVALRARQEMAAPVAAEPAPPFTVAVDEDGLYHVTGAEVELALVRTDLDNEEAVMMLHRRLTRLGVLDALRKAGCSSGDAVEIGGIILDFED